MNRLRLGHPLTSLRPALTNGPGWRIGLWVQGCRLRCTRSCLNPHLLDPEAGLAFDPELVARAVVDVAGSAPVRVEGLTVLGGEPTEQAAALLPLLDAVRASGMTVMIYSGHRHEDLRDPDVMALLARTDLLVDGPFRESEYDEHLVWRGSANQRLLRLTDAYSEADLDHAMTAQRKAFSIQVRPDGAMSVSGLQERAGAGRIEKKLRAMD